MPRPQGGYCDHPEATSEWLVEEPVGAVLRAAEAWRARRYINGHAFQDIPEATERLTTVTVDFDPAYVEESDRILLRGEPGTVSDAEIRAQLYRDEESVVTVRRKFAVAVFIVLLLAVGFRLAGGSATGDVWAILGLFLILGCIYLVAERLLLNATKHVDAGPG